MAHLNKMSSKIQLFFSFTWNNKKRMLSNPTKDLCIFERLCELQLFVICYIFAYSNFYVHFFFSLWLVKYSFCLYWPQRLSKFLKRGPEKKRRSWEISGKYLAKGGIFDCQVRGFSSWGIGPLGRKLRTTTARERSTTTRTRRVVRWSKNAYFCLRSGLEMSM